jgi:hypothetical protein
VDHAVFLQNHVPREDTGLSPHDLFTKLRWPHAKFHDLYVWGCPLYTLDKRIAGGHKLPRWQARSERQVHLGLSKRHLSTVPLELDSATGSITSQYHVVFTDWFSTVSLTTESLPDMNSDEWNNIFGDSEYQYPLDHDPVGPSKIPPYDTPLLVDSYDIDDSRYQLPRDHPQDGHTNQREPPTEQRNQRESSQQRETSDEQVELQNQPHPCITMMTLLHQPSPTHQVLP